MVGRALARQPARVARLAFEFVLLPHRVRPVISASSVPSITTSRRIAADAAEGAVGVDQVKRVEASSSSR